MQAEPPPYADVVAEILFPPPAYTARPCGSTMHEAVAAVCPSLETRPSPAPYSPQDPQTQPILLRSAERDASGHLVHRWWERQTRSEMESTMRAATGAFLRHQAEDQPQWQPQPRSSAPPSYTHHNPRLARAALTDVDAYGRPVRRWWDHQVQADMRSPVEVARQQSAVPQQPLRFPQPQEESWSCAPAWDSLYDSRFARTTVADVDAYGRPVRRWWDQQPYTGLWPQSRLPADLGSNSHTQRELGRRNGIYTTECGRLQMQTARRSHSPHRPRPLNNQNDDVEAQSNTNTTEIEAAQRLERGEAWSESRGRYKQLPERAKDDTQATGCIRELTRPGQRDSRFRQAMWRVLGFCAAPALLLAVLVVCVLALMLFAVSWLLWVVGLSEPAQLEQTTFYRFIERSTETCMTGRWGLVSLLEIK